MSHVIIPLPGIGTLRLTQEAYDSALIPIAAPAPSPAATQQSELVDGKEMAKRTGLPVSYLMEQARRGKLPSMRVGKYRRFDPVAVMAKLLPNQLVASQSLQNKRNAKACDRDVPTLPRSARAVEAAR